MVTWLGNGGVEIQTQFLWLLPNASSIFYTTTKVECGFPGSTSGKELTC